MRRLSAAGFKADFVRPAILPDWWEESCAPDSALLPDIEIRVARFLDVPISTIRNAGAALAASSYPSAQLRRVRDIDRDRLAPAIHSAIRIAAATVRNLRDRSKSTLLPPQDAIAWRQQVVPAGKPVTLQDLLTDLWTRGLPVVPLDMLPTPGFQAAACIAEGRPVIVLGHKYDEPGRAAFLVAHETGHVAAGDCTPDQPVIDEEDEVADDADIERRADRYATRVLVGGDSVPAIDGATFKELANAASRGERETGADASAVIFAWARKTGEYAKASMAVKALYRSSGARRLLREHFDRHVDIDAAPESDRALLRCVYGDPDRHAATG
jgi:hypothetical protein